MGIILANKATTLIIYGNNMAKTWSEVEQSVGYKQLNPQQKIEAKKSYWSNVVQMKPEFQSLDDNAKISAEKQFFGGRISDFSETIEKQNVFGKVFNVPGAAIRSAFQGKGYTAGAINPSKVRTFQDLALENLSPKTTSTAVNFAGGLIPSAVGLAADIITQPANLLPGLVGQTSVGKAAGQAIMSTKPAQKLSKLATTDLTKIFSKNVDKADEIIDASINKAIRPSVAGKQTFGQVEKYNKNARLAVKTIVDNKDELSFIDDAGNSVNKLPESLNEFSDAISQVKTKLYSQVDDLLNQAGRNSIRLNTISNELNSVINNKVIQLKDPNVIEYAKSLKTRFDSIGQIGVKEADDLIKAYNESLKAFYRNPSYENASRVSVDAMVVNRLRNSLDGVVTSLTGKNFQDLKTKYSALKTIEKDVINRAIVDARKNAKGLIDFTDIFSAGDIVRGLSTMNPADIAKGTIQTAVKSYLKAFNDPNRYVKNMFSGVSKVYQPKEAPYLAGMENPAEAMKYYGLSTVKQGQPGQRVLALPAPGIDVSKLPTYLKERISMPQPPLGASGVAVSSNPIQTKGYVPPRLPAPPATYLSERASMPIESLGVKGNTGQISIPLQAPKVAAGLTGLATVGMAGNSQASELGENLTKDFEGFSGKIYLDTEGKRTIGYGFNIDDKNIRSQIPKEVLNGKRSLSKQEANIIFNKLYKDATNDAINFIGKDRFNRLSENRKNVIIDMSYNLGISKLNGFKDFKAALLKGDYNKAADEMINSKWYKQVGRRSKALVRMMRND